MHIRGLHTVTFTLAMIGALNWGLYLFNWDVAEWGLPSGLVRTIYALVALSAIYEIASHGMRCKECRGEMGHIGHNHPTAV
jgi:uncharacterized membrane protein YuzA (DUF378 family)